MAGDLRLLTAMHANKCIVFHLQNVDKSFIRSKQRNQLEQLYGKMNAKLERKIDVLTVSLAVYRPRRTDIAPHLSPHFLHMSTARVRFVEGKFCQEGNVHKPREVTLINSCRG